MSQYEFSASIGSAIVGAIALLGTKKFKEAMRYDLALKKVVAGPMVDMSDESGLKKRDVVLNLTSQEPMLKDQDLEVLVVMLEESPGKWEIDHIYLKYSNGIQDHIPWEESLVIFGIGTAI